MLLWFCTGMSFDNIMKYDTSVTGGTQEGKDPYTPLGLCAAARKHHCT
jgi:hypothetical protein